jgi:hypothetical protein
MESCAYGSLFDHRSPNPQGVRMEGRPMIWYRRMDGGFGVCNLNLLAPSEPNDTRCHAAYNVGRRVYQATVCPIAVRASAIAKHEVPSALVTSLLVGLGECIMGYM